MREKPIVVAAPMVFDASNAMEVGDQLRSALRQRSVVIADLSITWACDLAAIGELVSAQQQAEASQHELWLVVASSSVLQQFAQTGLDSQLRIYPSVSIALDRYEQLEASREEAS